MPLGATSRNDPKLVFKLVLYLVRRLFQQIEQCHARFSSFVDVLMSLTLSRKRLLALVGSCVELGGSGPIVETC